MAWSFPKDHGDWEGFAWAHPAIINAMLDGAAMRATAVSQAGGGGSVTADHVVVGVNLQSIGQWNQLRPRDTVPSGSHVLTLTGGYATDYAGTAADTLDGSARWVDKSGIFVGNEWVESEEKLWSSAGGFTTRFLDLVNEKLDDWGLDPMGSSLLDHGGGEADIPWTRKYGDKTAPSTAYGRVAVGDIIGEWIFNEWRAVLEVLDAIAKTPTWETPDSWIVWEGSASGEVDCAGAKSAVTSAWEDARTRPVSPIEDPPANVAATGSLDWDPGEGMSGNMTRAWVEFNISNCGAVTNGEWNIFIHARKWGDSFENFDDANWEEDKIGQIEVTTTAPFMFSPADFKDPSTDDEEINRVPCPEEHETETRHTAIGYELDAAPQMVVVVTYPDP